ncbi:MAG: hypothetical protein IPI64_04245 [Chloracidobacterium sp.]|nr:hypothetical protein [Chloracidobacterium sp.]
MNESFDWRRSDRRIFATIAVVFPLIILVGFARTYYLKFIFGGESTNTLLVHTHALLMSAWVIFFVTQVWLIRTKNAKIHMNLGMLGIALAIAIVVVGFFTGVSAAKYGSPANPPDIPPLPFLVVPFFDVVLFALLFGGAIYFRKRPADHKRLMLLTALGFLPPGLGRFPIASLQSLGPLFFFGVPTVLAIGFLIYDTWRNGKLNKVFLLGTLILAASYPLRLVLSGTDAWMRFATWLTTWAA